MKERKEGMREGRSEADEKIKEESEMSGKKGGGQEKRRKKKGNDE